MSDIEYSVITSDIIKSFDCISCVAKTCLIGSNFTLVLLQIFKRHQFSHLVL